MKYKTLLSCVMSFVTLSLAAQQKISGYAITGPNKGERGWKQVRMVDMKSGAEMKAVYTPSEETEILDYRTGKAVQKKDPAQGTAKIITTTNGNTQYYTVSDLEKMAPNNPAGNITVTRDAERIVIRQKQETAIAGNTDKKIAEPKTFTRTIVYKSGSSYDQPFATTSAAAAYDKKHDRLYYTPMGIPELRFIDLKAKKPTVYYFQNETFGAVEGMHDAGNQVTRMVIGADGNGYAISNNANHLIKFTTGKKPVITDLGAIADDASNGRFSIHSSGAYGGDVVAGKSGSLYLLTASRHVFKIDIEQKTALHLGVIKGLPAGFSTNGAMVEEGMNIIVASSDSPEGYFIVDVNTLQAQKYSTGGQVYNASDLAGSNLLEDKKSKKEQKEEVVEQPVTPAQESKTVTPPAPLVSSKAINVYPNPVTNGEVKISFNTLPAGRYMIQLTDLNGQVITTSDVVVGSKNQVETLRLPALISKGSYLVKVQASGGREAYTETIIVQ